MDIMKTVTVLILAISALCSTNCTSSKELNEKSARGMIKEATANARYPVPVRQFVGQFMQKSLVDNGQTAASAKANKVAPEQAIMAFGRLLDQNFMVLHVDTLQYPQIQGSYIVDVDPKLMTSEYKLEMIPGTNNIRGSMTQKDPLSPLQRYVITGRVETDGSVSLTLDRGRTYHYQYKQEGSKARLINKGDMFGQNFTGTPGSMVDAKWYTYSLSSDVQFLDNANANGGRYEIGGVSGLQLLTDTQAVAHFAWTAALNKLGRAFYGSLNPNGNGFVEFGKKPDGTWFVQNYQMGQPAF